MRLPLPCSACWPTRPPTQAIDGTGWVRESLDGKPRDRPTGQIFRIAMYHDNHPDKHYEMANQVNAFEPDRAIALAARLGRPRTATSNSAAGSGATTSPGGRSSRPRSR